MQSFPVSFKLKNMSSVAINAILIGATAFAASRQKDAVLTDGTFKSEDGLADITVTNVLTSGQTIQSLQEFIAAFGCKITEVKLLSDSHIQATHRFTEKTFMPIQPDLVNLIPANLTLGEGFDTHKVIHTFSMPFYSAPNKSLCLTLEPDKEVQVEMMVHLNVNSLS